MRGGVAYIYIYIYICLIYIYIYICLSARRRGLSQRLPPVAPLVKLPGRSSGISAAGFWSTILDDFFFGGEVWGFRV